MIKTNHIVKPSPITIEVFVYPSVQVIHIFKKLNIFKSQWLGKYRLHSGTEDLDILVIEFIKKKQIEFEIPDANVRIIDRMNATPPKDTGMRTRKGQ